MTTTNKISIQAPDECLIKKVVQMGDGRYRPLVEDLLERISFSQEKVLNLVKEQYPGREIVPNTAHQLMSCVISNDERLMEAMEYGPTEEEHRKMKVLADACIRVEVYHPEAKDSLKFLVLPSEKPKTVKAKDLDAAGLEYDKETGEVSGMIFKDSKALSIMDKLNIQEKEEYPAAYKIKATAMIV
jgi:hypothetical protein